MEWHSAHAVLDSCEKFMSFDPLWVYGPDFYDSVDLIETAFGDHDAHYGAVQSYLLRRFGQPVRGSDPYKEICAYILTTPDPRLHVRVTPHPGKSIGLTFQAYASSALHETNRKWEMLESDQWRMRFDRWAEERVGRARDPVTAKLIQEINTYRISKIVPPGIGAGVLFLSHSNPARDTEKADIILAAKSILDAFAERDPFPGIRMRPKAAEDLEADDPLRDVLVALKAFAADMRRGVRVRDMAINIFGPCETADFDEHTVTGFAFGALLNEAPVEVVALMSQLRTAGQGDIVAGLKQVTELLSRQAGEEPSPEM